MSRKKCCVNGCESTSNTHKLFCMPKNDNLRNLWMSFLVPTSPCLLLLSKDQLLTKRVCRKHFDKTQFDVMGERIRYSYPCLFTEDEFFHGVPLCSDEYNVLQEHNYFNYRESADDIPTEEPTVLMGMPGNVPSLEHVYGLPLSSQAGAKLRNEGVSISSVSLAAISEKENIEMELFLASQPSTSKGNSDSKTPLTDISQITNIETEEIYKGMPKQSFSKGLHAVSKSVEDSSQIPKIETESINKRTPKQPLSKVASGFKQFNSKTRRFIKETTKMATDSLGKTGLERLQSARIQAEQVELIENFVSLNKQSKSFLLMQLRLARKNKLARRFSLEEKIFALTLLKQSPKGYKLLEHIFALPTKRTLARLAEKITFECGLNSNTIEYIKKCTKDWDDKKRLCSLVFDEVALTPHLTYNESKDEINGFVDIAGERKQKFADHALVFMIRGICSPWRQSIAYYFCEGTVSAPDLENILKQLIPKLLEAGLKPLVLVCDQGSTFRSCFKNIRQWNTRNPRERELDDGIEIAGQKLFIIHDAPHLLKGIRNNFIDKDILFDGKRASWEDILYIYDLDNKSGHTRALPKLTADHVDPKKMKKMKVKVAAQVLSARTAAMLNYTDALHNRLGDPRETMKTTAEAVLFFDELFDSVNGSPGQSRGKMRCAVTKTSVHMEFWQASLKKLIEIKYIDTKSKLAVRTGKPRFVRVPSLEGWITTLKSFLGLAKLLFNQYNVEYFYPRLINQDPLENFFGRIRAFNYRNVNPDVNAFVYTFKSLVISSILMPQSKFANCEDDEGDTLIDFNYLFTSAKVDKEITQVSNRSVPSSSSQSDPQRLTVKNVIYEKVNVQTSAYTAGYICRKITKKNNCNVCTKTYTTKEIDGTHELIKHREYKRLKNNNLTYPNGRILRLYREAAQIIHGFLNNHCEQQQIKLKLLNIITKMNMSWLGCTNHKEEVKRYVINLIIRLHVHNWCNIINKILRGKIEEKYVPKMHMHVAALKKYKVYRLRQKATKNSEKTD